MLERMERQLHKLHLKLHDFSLREISSKELKALQKEIEEGSYKFSFVTEKVVQARGKRRLVYRPQVLDLLVMGVLAEELAEKMEPHLSNNLYSFRKGRSSWDAVFKLQERVRKSLKEKKEIYFFKGDIESYTDSIPLGEGTPLWQMLDELGVSALHKEALCPLICHLDGTLSKPQKGILAGTPLVAPLSNWYLRVLDQRMEKMGDWVRFGDDFIFFADSEAGLKQAEEVILTVIEPLKLKLKESKKVSGKLFSGSGGYSVVDLLGFKLTSNGHIQLGKARGRRMLDDLRKRLRNVLSQAKSDRLQLAIMCTNEYLNLNGLFKHRGVDWLMMVADDRAYLKHLDFEIAKILIEEVVQQKGARVLRRLSYHEVRERGLRSLCQMKNQL